MRAGRLGPRLLAAIVLASTLLALVATGIQLYLDYTRDLSEIDGEFHQVEVSYLDSLSRSLWSFDRRQTQIQLEGLVKMRDVEFAELQGRAGEHLVAGRLSDTRKLERQYQLFSPDAQRRPIGTLRVVVGLGGVYARLLDRLTVILATQATKAFLIALFALYIIARWVTQPLDALARHARALTLDNLAQPLVLPRGPRHRPDELDAVAAALNDTSHSLADEIERRVEAERGSQAKSAFLAKMSHELRTPLNSILGYAQLLQMEGSLDPHQRKVVATIHASGEHLLALINDLLDLAKIEAGRLDLAPSEVELGSLLYGVADIVRVRAQQKGLAFVVDIEPGLPGRVTIDGRALRQVLLNLLANAVKFTDQGTVRLAVRRLPPASPPRVHFTVEDSGIGMSEEQCARLFQPFEQVGAAERRTGGTGLGLAISRQLVQALGGDILVESRPGAGSRFWFELPLQAAEEQAAGDRATTTGHDARASG